MLEKTVEQSKVTIGNLMQPYQANPNGNVHGGEIMKMMDNTAGLVAYKHARMNVVTARVDELEFHLPIHIGNLVTCCGQITFVGSKSMEVLVTVFVEDIMKDQPKKIALTGLFTMVALNELELPTDVPKLVISNEEEQELHDAGKLRYLAYKERRNRK